MKKVLKIIVRVLIALVVVVVVACAGFAVWSTQSYHATDRATSCLAQAQATETDPNEYDFGDPSSATGIVIYPGAAVPYEAYAPLAQAIADEGYFVAVVQMPLNFALLGIDEASAVMARHTQVGSWYVAGHSLGGVCASYFAADHADKVAGVILLAAYSSADLSATNLRVLSIYGSEDGVLRRDEYANAQSNLPASFTERVIEGGNHGQFGSYGEQSGDGIAVITPEEQWEQTAKAIKQFIG